MLEAMEFPKPDIPRPRTAAEIQADHLATAARDAGVAEAYRLEAGDHPDGDERRRALMRYAVGYQEAANRHLRLGAIAPADDLTEPPIPQAAKAELSVTP
jgi:hypothetical protein